MEVYQVLIMRERKRRTVEAQPVKFTLDQALAYLQERCLSLYCTDERDGGSSPVDIWSSNVKVPIGVRRTVFQHRYEILDMMRAGAAAVCPARSYHRHSWHYNRSQKRYYCRVCVRLEPEIWHSHAVESRSTRAKIAS